MKRHIDPQDVLVLRHTPKAPRLRKLLPWLAGNSPDVFNAYQQIQGKDVEREMKKATYVASFIGNAPEAALFVGLYERYGECERAAEDIRSEPTIRELENYGSGVETNPRLWFDLRLRDDFFGDWKGNLVIQWSGGAINWHRRADRGPFKVIAIHPESLLCKQPPDSYRQWDIPSSSSE